MSAVTAEIFTIKKEGEWALLKNAKSGWFTTTLNLPMAVNFILASLDEAIKYAQENMVGGADKKAFVMNVISRLYDTAIGSQLPVWAYPFASYLKTVIVDNFISNLIDWTVAKYKSGVWNITK